MPDEYEADRREAGHAGGAAINKTIRMVADLWEEVFQEELIIQGQSPTQRRDYLLDVLRMRLRDTATLQKFKDGFGSQWNEPKTDPNDFSSAVVDILVGEAEGVSSLTSIDDFSPNQFFSSLRTECQRRVQSGRFHSIPLPDLLRAVLDRMFQEAGATRRIRVGRNRHFPRIIKYLREYEAETTWGDRQGFKLMNANPGGPVRQYPTEPATLRVRLDPDIITG